MSISKKMYLLVSCATMISMASFCDEVIEQPRKLQEPQEQLLIFSELNNPQEQVSILSAEQKSPQLQKNPQLSMLQERIQHNVDTATTVCEFFYHPIAITGLFGAAVGKKHIGKTAIGALALINADLILKGVNYCSENSHHVSKYFTSQPSTQDEINKHDQA